MLRGRRAEFLRNSIDPLPYLARLVQIRACFERTPFWCRAAVGRLKRAPAGLLSSTEEFAPNSMAVTWFSWQSWNLSGCYGPPGMLSFTSRNIHAHRRTQAGCWAEPARMSAKCRPGCRASIDRPIDC